MPSGRTHDAITFILAAPAFAITYAFVRDVSPSAILTGAFLFGGLMFGPDLDTVSRQYSRWSIFRYLWFPYRSFFKHRSRFSHGLIFGALIRVIYFMGVVSLIVFLAVYIYAAYSGGVIPAIGQIGDVWRPIGVVVRERFEANMIVIVFVGLWLGAASHTVTDIIGTFVKTGRSEKFF
ncbi:MAG: metal-binding protein [Pyrinomonadaceae bacterium]